MVNCNRPTTLTFMGRRVLVVDDDDVLRREVNARLSGNSFRASAELPIKNEHRGRNAGGESLSPPESGQTLPEVALGRRLGDPCGTPPVTTRPSAATNIRPSTH